MSLEQVLTPEEVWDTFWKDICEKDGVVDMTQVKRELSDYHMMLDIVPKVYCHATGGIISKPLTCAASVISCIDDHVNDVVRETIEEGDAG